MAEPKKTVKNNKSLTGALAFGLTALLLYFPPCFRGLYFNQELYVTFAIIALTLGIWAYSARQGGNEMKSFGEILDYLGLVLMLAYLIPVFVAFNVKEAVMEFLKTGYFFAVYYLVSRLIGKKQDVEGFFKVIFFSGVGVAFLGIGSAFGTFNIIGAFDPDKRISSTIQYANSLAVFLMPAMLTGYYLAVVKARDVVEKIAYSLGTYLMFLAFMGTLSRGGMLVLALIMPLFIIGMPKEYRWQTALNFLFVTLSAMLISDKSLDFTVVSTGAARWGWLLLGALIMSGLILGSARFGERFSREIKNKKFLIGGLGALVTLFLLVAVSVKAIPTAKLAPGRVIERVQSIGLSERNVQERFVFYSDGMKIIKESPIFGSGGGAWDAVYRKYRSYYYITADVHNHYLKYQKGQDSNGLAKSREYIDKALGLNPTNPDLYEISSKIYFADGKAADGVKVMETALSLDPWEKRRYEVLADTYLYAAKELLAKGDKEGVRGYLAKAAGLPEVINGRMGKLSPLHRSLWTTHEVLQVTPSLQEKVNEAKNLSTGL
ncbi:MAG: O-antigen ligase family protein [Clostridia bacterium]|nr:O-antigen ligase family protein [Clostridia bacterium]